MTIAPAVEPALEIPIASTRCLLNQLAITYERGITVPNENATPSSRYAPTITLNELALLAIRKAIAAITAPAAITNRASQLSTNHPAINTVEPDENASALVSSVS